MFQLGSGYIVIEKIGKIIDIAANKIGIVCGKMLKAEDLERKTHIHNLGRMTVTGGKVDKSAFGEYVESASVVEYVTNNAVTAFVLTCCHLFKLFEVDFDIEMASVG